MRLVKIKGIPFPQNLWSMALDQPPDEVKLPADWEAAFAELMSSIKTKEAETLSYYFKDGMSWKDIACIYGCSVECARQIAAKAIYKLRHPSRRPLLVHGLAQVEGIKSTHFQCAASKGKNSILEQKITTTTDILGISPLIGRKLWWAGIKTVADLTNTTEKQLLEVRQLGPKTLETIKQFLSEYGLSLKEEPDHSSKLV